MNVNLIREERVQVLAKEEIERVNARLKEKEAAIDERISKQPKSKVLSLKEE